MLEGEAEVERQQEHGGDLGAGALAGCAAAAAAVVAAAGRLSTPKASYLEGVATIPSA